MNLNEEQIRAAIAEQAGDWLVANEEGLDERDAATLAVWLKTSPVHVEEFLGVAAIARDLKEARTDPEYSLDAILARARAEESPTTPRLWLRIVDAVRGIPASRWFPAAVATAACAVLSLGLIIEWNTRPIERPSTSSVVAALHFETRHGEQLNRRLADNSMLQLNTDSAVTILYSQNERLVVLTSGEAVFEVAHEPDRPFRVIAGSAEVVDLGTKFDVRLEHAATVVTVVMGRVAVGPSRAMDPRGPNSKQNSAPRFVRLDIGEQLRVDEGVWPATPRAVDAESITAWLRKEIVFDHEPLEHVAAEFNRYSPTPIEVVTPALRSLQISGVFATDDTDAFIAFLRSLKGVRVEVTSTQIRVSRD